MSRVGKTNEKRTEQRLRYRWPVRFATKVGQKPLRGQIVDVTSTGLAFLCHPGEDCPGQDEFVTTGFGVPHFNAHGSFDTVLFNRVGRVCRVDSLNDKVSRVAVQFAEPLFFQPGQQSLSDSQVQQRLEAHARSLIEARRANAASGQVPVRATGKAAAKRRSPTPAAKRSTRKKNAKRNASPPADGGLLKKVDSFFTDKSKVF